MRRVLAVLVVLVCGLLVSACGLLPILGGVFDSDEELADARMELIVEALDDHDAGALAEVFSPVALERATGFEEDADYLFSFFPDGGVTWERENVSASGHNKGGRRSLLLRAVYKVSAGGEDYRLFFADFPVNDVENPANVGVYGLGVTPWTEARSDADPGFSAWANGIGLTSDGEYGYPGIYVPNDAIVYPSEQADARMEQIVAAVNSQDAAALKAMFSANALDAAIAFEQRLASLLAMFPNGGLTWEQDAVNTIGDDTGKVSKLLTTGYKVSADGREYRLFFADFVVNANDPDNIGLASLAVTPWFDPWGDDKDQAYIDWTSSWGHDADGRVGIYVPTD